MASSNDEPTDLQQGRAAYARQAWETAYQCLSSADAISTLALADLEKLTWAAALTGRDEQLIELFERLHQDELARSNPQRAAYWALWLALRLGGLGEAARARGWFGRAERLLSDIQQPCVEHGYLLVPRAQRLLAQGDTQQAQRIAAQAVHIAQRFADPDLLAFAYSLQARTLIARGELEQGLALFDECLVGATSGDTSPIVTGLMYCWMISCCQRIYAFDRTREWTDVLERWCDGQPELVTFTGPCLIHRSEVLQLSGSWPQALQRAREAAERFASATDRGPAAEAHYATAEVLRLQGALAEAEREYLRASELGHDPQPGLALLRLAQGQLDVAVQTIRRIHTEAVGDLAKIKILPSLVEIVLAAGHTDEAEQGAHELQAIATRFNSPLLDATAGHARAAVHLTRAQPAAALALLRPAVRAWQEVGAPYLVARLRAALARACAALGDTEGAALEREAARRAFADLGATLDLARLQAAESASEAARGATTNTGQGALPAGVALTPRELEVLQLVATGKTNKQLAQQLGVSEKTIDRHVSNLFGKIGVNTRAAATAFAYQNRLL